MHKNIPFLKTLFTLCLVSQIGAKTEIVLDTTITILKPSEGSQTLGFPSLGFELEYIATLVQPCPQGTIEGSLRVPNGSNNTIRAISDSSALFLILYACPGNTPLFIPNITGQEYEVTTPLKNYVLTVLDAGNNAIQFIFDDPSLQVFTLENFHPTSKPQNIYNIKGKRIFSDNRPPTPLLWVSPQKLK